MPPTEKDHARGREPTDRSWDLDSQPKTWCEATRRERRAKEGRGTNERSQRQHCVSPSPDSLAPLKATAAERLKLVPSKRNAWHVETHLHADENDSLHKKEKPCVIT